MKMPIYRYPLRVSVHTCLQKLSPHSTFTPNREFYIVVDIGAVMPIFFKRDLIISNFRIIDQGFFKSYYPVSFLSWELKV